MTKIIPNLIPISAIREVVNINWESANVYAMYAGVGPIPVNQVGAGSLRPLLGMRRVSGVVSRDLRQGGQIGLL
jgi:hypothetical protein